MKTINRYLLTFGMIGILAFIIILTLIVMDDCKLLKPIMLITISLSDLIFVLLMSLLFNSLAKPITYSLQIDNREKFIAIVSDTSIRKWGRKVIKEDKNYISYKFGNKYKDWLTTPMEIKFDGNKAFIIMPNYYKEDIINVIRKM